MFSPLAPAKAHPDQRKGLKQNRKNTNHLKPRKKINFTLTSNAYYWKTRRNVKSELENCALPISLPHSCYWQNTKTMGQRWLQSIPETPTRTDYFWTAWQHSTTRRKSNLGGIKSRRDTRITCRRGRTIVIAWVCKPSRQLGISKVGICNRRSWRPNSRIKIFGKMEIKPISHDTPSWADSAHIDRTTVPSTRNTPRESIPSRHNPCMIHLY